MGDLGSVTDMAIIEIATAEGPAEAYVARPSDSGDYPGVLFFMDAYGMRPQIEAMAERIASWGYVVLVPNLFFRSGRVAELIPTVDLKAPGERERLFAELGPRIQPLTAEVMDADSADYLAGLRLLTGVSPGDIGVTGYCLGARWATRIAGTQAADVAAVGGFHGGRLVTDAPDSPHLVLAQARAEFVYGHADQDTSMPPEAVAALGETLAAHHLTATNEIYPGAAHGYTMADTSSYNEAGAERHFVELRALLGRTLGR